MIALRTSGLLDLLACPSCRHGLETTDPQWLRCRSCGSDYPIRDAIPHFVHLQELPVPSSRVGHPLGAVSPNGHSPGFSPKALLKRLFPKVSATVHLHNRLFDHVNSLPGGSLVLNLGSSIGRFDGRIKHLMVNLDWNPGPLVDVVADAHRLPFGENVFDGVYSNALLEHVARPWVVAEEIRRVLKPGGIACIGVPFLNIVHESHDYYRFTEMGLRELFAEFETVESGIASGPSSFITYFLPEYLAAFVPTNLLKTLVRDLAAIVLFPIKYLDLLVNNRERFTLIANAFYYVGRKR